MAGYDHKCPYCDTEMPLHKMWVSREYEADFQVNCDKCSRTVQVDVESEPVFETSKPRCMKCYKGEPVNQWYCQKCQDELNALSAHLEAKA